MRLNPPLVWVFLTSEKIDRKTSKNKQKRWQNANIFPHFYSKNHLKNFLKKFFVDVIFFGKVLAIGENKMKDLLVKIPNKNDFMGSCLLSQVFPPLILVSPVTRP